MSLMRHFYRGKQRSIPATSGHRRGYPGPQPGRMVRSGEVPANILHQAGTRDAGTALLQALAARPVTAGQDRRCLSGAYLTNRAPRRADTGTGRAAHTASARSPAREGRRPGEGDPGSGAGSRPHRRPGHQRHRDGPVRAENRIHGSDQQSCSPDAPPVMIAGHVPAVRLPPGHAGGLMAVAVPA